MEICKWKMKLAADTKIYQIWKITNNEMDDVQRLRVGLALWGHLEEAPMRVHVCGCMA